MSLFHIGKKEDKQSPACCCGSDTMQEQASACCGREVSTEPCSDISKGISSIKVLGAGCKSCHEQYVNVKNAVTLMQLPIQVEYVTDMEKVMAYGVMSMPAIVVNEKVVSMGKVLKNTDVVKLLSKFM